MSVLSFVKGIIGKQDINWGDSSTTFSVETHLGGSTNLNYIDAECIPSTTLGNYIGTHLHRQNTDSLTTATKFGINSTGNSVVLDSTGLTASRTFTFPDTSNQAFVGATDLVSTAASKGASKVGVQDSGNYFTGTNVETVLQELGSDVDNLNTTGFERGRKQGFKLAYSSTIAVTISGGMWGHAGTTDQYVYMNAQATFTLGPGGSNAGSTALDASQIHYIYVDDSAVVTLGVPLITATQFMNSTTAPAYSHSKRGWYNGSDRCIGAVLTNASSEIRSFMVFSDNYYRYANPIVEFAVAAAAVSYTSLDISSTIPAFSTRARLRILNVVAGRVIYFDTSSTAVTPEGQTMSTGTSATYTYDVPTSLAQVVYWYISGHGNVAIDTTGYYIDEL